MKSTAFKFFSFTAFIILILNFVVAGQITSTTSNGNTRTAEVAQAQNAVNNVLDDSGKYFKEGLQAFKENRRPEAGDSFDRSVETFLLSTLNIQKDQKLLTCYNQLIETVYRIEFPAQGQLPQIRSLSATCGWRSSSGSRSTDAACTPTPSPRPGSGRRPGTPPPGRRRAHGRTRRTP